MCFLLPFSHQYRHGTSQKGKIMFLIIPLTVSLLLLVGLALVQLAHSNPIWFDNGCSIPISLHGTTKSPIYFSNIFPRLPFCSGQFPFAISNDRPQNIIGMIPNLQINMTTDSYIFRKKKKNKILFFPSAVVSKRGWALLTNGILCSIVTFAFFLVFVFIKQISWPLGVLFAARASRIAPRFRIIVNFCHIGPKRILTKNRAMNSTRTNIYSPPAMTNEIHRRSSKGRPLRAFRRFQTPPKTPTLLFIFLQILKFSHINKTYNIYDT